MEALLVVDVEHSAASLLDLPGVYVFLSLVLRLPFLNHARLPLVLIIFINFLLLELYCPGYLHGKLT